MSRRSDAVDADQRDLTWVQLLGLLAFIALAAWTVLLGGGARGVYYVGPRVVSLSLIGIGLIVWAFLAWRRTGWRPSSAIWPALIAPPLALAVATLLSPTPRLGIEYVAWSVLLAALYLLLVRVIALGTMQVRIGGIAAALTLVIGLTYAAEVLVEWVEFWSLVGRLTPPPLRPSYASLTLGNPSAVMALMALLWIATFAGLGVSTTARRTVVLATGALALFAVVISGSRAGWLSLGAAVGFVGLIWLFAADHRGRLAAALTRPRIRAGLLVGALALIVVGLAVLPGILLRTSDGGDGGRTTYWATALRMFADAPATGIGPGGWATARIRYTESGELDYYIPHAHDIYVQAAAELGVIGLVAGAIVVATVGWLVVGAMRDQDRDRNRWGWCALLGLTYFAAHQTLDFYMNVPALLFAASIPVAFLDATATARLPGALGRPPGAARRLGIIVLAVACSISLAGLGRYEQIALIEQETVDLADAGGVAGAAIGARQAASHDPSMPPYQLTLGLAEMGSGSFEEAAHAFEHVATADDLPQAWLDLAYVELVRGRLPEARAAVGRALRLGVQQPLVAYGAGSVLERIGDTAAARAAYVEALVRLPSLADDPPPGGSGAASSWASIVDQAQEASPEAAWELALVGETEGEALKLANLTDDPRLAELVTRGWHGDPKAIVEIEALAEASPLSVDPIHWAARLNARAGDQEAAARFRRWGAIIGGVASVFGYDVRIGTVAESLAQGARAGSRATFHGTYVYRRPTPQDMLAGDLPRLVYE